MWRSGSTKSKGNLENLPRGLTHPQGVGRRWASSRCAATHLITGVLLHELPGLRNFKIGMMDISIMQEIT